MPRYESPYDPSTMPNALEHLIYEKKGHVAYVTINRPESIRPEHVLQRIDYEHPLFSLGATSAQAEIPALNQAAIGTTETFFAGAWQRYGFHEDGLLSAHRLAAQLLARDSWPA